jgi:Flp pilus assembly protein TadG
MKIVFLGSLALTFGLSAAADAQSVSPTQSVAKASASDKFEIASAKLETTSTNPPSLSSRTG